MLLEIGKISLEIFLIAWLIYGILIFIRGTRAGLILSGLFVFSIVTTLTAQILNLTVIDYFIGKIWAFIPILLAIVFQSEIRRALTILGRQQFKKNKYTEDNSFKTIINACFYLAHNKTGALLALENNISMKPFQEGGSNLDADISLELLTTIFFKNTPLHDGGLTIKDNKITTAGCIFPLTDKINLPKSIGLRHRAALGISEETDCVCLVVSEETGFVSFAFNGELTLNINETQLLYNLTKHFTNNSSNTSFLKKLKKRFPRTKKQQDA